MIGIAQNDLRVQIIQQIARQHAFDGGLRAHRHEDRSLDVAMRGVKNARARAGVGTGGLKLESRHRSYCKLALADRRSSARL